MATRSSVMSHACKGSRGKEGKMKFESSADREQLLSALQKLISIKSVKYDGLSPEEYEPSEGRPFGHGISDALEYTLELCKSLGMKTKNCQGYAGYAETGEGEEMLGILMHLDVVPEGKGWTYPPYGGEIHDGRLYGRGAVDDKGPAIASIFALRALMDEGCKLNKRVRLIFGTDEENDWQDMDYYTAHEELPHMGFTPDADFPVIYGEMGILQFDFVIEDSSIPDDFIKGGEAANAVADYCEAHVASQDGTVEKIASRGIAAHASTPEKGENAISKVMEALYDQYTQSRLSCCQGISDFIKFYHDKIGFNIHGEKIGCHISDKETGLLTFNAGKVASGKNKIVLSIDMRCPATFKEEDIMSRLRKEISGYNIKIENVDFLKPVFSDCDSFLVKTLLEVYREETGDSSKPLTMGGGTYARAMDNIVAFGPLFPGREATEHMANEYILTDDLMKITKIYAEAIKRLCGK